MQLNNTKNTTTSLNTLFNPTYQPNWSGTYVQPLFRNFRIDATRRSLQVTKINRDISDLQLRSTITNTLSNVRNAYWDYVFAVQSVDVASQSVALATQLVQGQPDPRRGRHHGADRRRPGAVAGGDAAADCWSRRSARCGRRSSRSSG